MMTAVLTLARSSGFRSSSQQIQQGDWQTGPVQQLAPKSVSQASIIAWLFCTKVLPMRW